MPDPTTQTNTTTPEQALSQSDLLAAEKLEAYAWKRCEREVPELQKQRRKLSTQIDEIREEWAKKYSKVKAIRRQLSAND